MPGLVSLRALHTLSFRTEDTCIWVKKEFRKFCVDNVSHHPEMKLEYLALETTVERLFRRVESKPPNLDPKGKGKSKSDHPYISKNTNVDTSIYDPTHVASADTLIQGLVSIVAELPTTPLWAESTAGEAATQSIPMFVDGTIHKLLDGASDDEGDEEGEGLRIEALEDVRFYDAPEVRIFEKGVLGGRL